MTETTTTPVVTITGVSFTTPDAIVAHYSGLTPSEKAAFRAATATALTDAVRTRAYDVADIVANVTLVTPKTTVEVDYVGTIATRRASLVAAIALIDAGHVVMPSGVTAPTFDVTSDVFTMATPAMADVDAFRTMSGRKSGRGNVIAYVESVVTDVPMTVAELRAAWTPSTDYPTAPPSAGAIGAAFTRVTDGADADFSVVTVRGVAGAVAI
jgi:hypothetical protein